MAVTMSDQDYSTVMKIVAHYRSSLVTEIQKMEAANHTLHRELEVVDNLFQNSSEPNLLHLNGLTEYTSDNLDDIQSEIDRLKERRAIVRDYLRKQEENELA